MLRCQIPWTASLAPSWPRRWLSVGAQARSETGHRPFIFARRTLFTSRSSPPRRYAKSEKPALPERIQQLAAQLGIAFPNKDQPQPFRLKCSPKLNKQLGISAMGYRDHVVRQWHMPKYFNPIEHPLSQWRLKQYAEKNNIPLWLHITPTSPQTLRPVVRSRAQRRVRIAVHQALRERGYHKGGTLLRRDTSQADKQGMWQAEAARSEANAGAKPLFGTVEITVSKSLVVATCLRSDIDDAAAEIVDGIIRELGSGNSKQEMSRGPSW